jgi:hypothetical protein
MKKNRIPTEQCTRCNGTGKTPLSDEMLAVYQAFTHTNELNAEQIVGGIGWKGHPTAINNRLEHLREIGLLERRKSSKTWFYRKAGKK